MEPGYVYKNHQRLKCGYTTGTCAAAATKAAVKMLFTKEPVTHVTITTPGNIVLDIKILDIKITENFVMCAVKKDAGDDADCTDGILIYSKVSFASSGITIDGGEGIGRITKPGLDQPIGAAAINSVPRKMIGQAAKDILKEEKSRSGLEITISAPQGKEIAQKTFNPRLGIEGGISILGTTGIVEPMSEKALIDTIFIEMKQKKALDSEILFITPGNYGKNFAATALGIDLGTGLKCSNYIGETLDMALMLGFKKILFTGHIGKLIKVAANIMNTHSRIADARMETLCSCAILAGCRIETAHEILSCATTDEALELPGMQDILYKTMDIMLNKILTNMKNRTENKIQIEAIVFSNHKGILAKSAEADKVVTALNGRTQELAGFYNTDRF